MKKIICLICMFLMLSVSAYSQTYHVAGTNEALDSGGLVVKSRYTIGVSAVLGTLLTLKLNTPFTTAQIVSVNYESASDNMTMYFHENESDTVTSVGQFLWITGFGDGVSPIIPPDTYYGNQSSPQKNIVFVTFDNKSATYTGISYLTVIYRRRKVK